MLNKGNFDQKTPARIVIGSKIELNKVSQVKANEKGITTLPIVYDGIESIAILDSADGVNIATKRI